MAVGFVQNAWNNNASAESISVTLTLTAGNGVVVTFISGGVGLGSLGGFAQTAGDTLTLAADINSGGTYQAQYYKKTVAGGSTTFTFGWTGATYIALYVTELSGLDVVDVSASTALTSGTSVSSGTTATTAQADEIAIATFNLDGSGSTSFGSISNGFTIPTNGDNMAGTAPRSLLCYKVLSATGAIETTLASGDGMAVTGLIATYKALASTARYLLVRN